MLKPDSVFLTDCGTTYYNDCLSKLVLYLQDHVDDVAGVTARQRVMGPKDIEEVQQYPCWWDPSNPNCVGSGTRIFETLKWWLSPAPLQGFEFEATFLLNTAMFTTVGALPVLPGPCQLMQWRHLANRHDNADNDGKGQTHTSYTHYFLQLLTRYDNCSFYFTESALDMYFRQLEMDLNTAGVVKSSLLLAEDRVLSFSLAFRNSGFKTEW